EREWARLRANDSLECRNCHEFEHMDFTQQSTRAARAHSTTLAEGEATCIDCHKGIAHELPDMGPDFEPGTAGLPGIQSWVAHLERDG
ncbi:NapC/NirT family cytochrome c, partial [Halomonas sp. BM-2019]|uniref:NapC/NirT family cytochrome c n=1 Tax=Halomonas sp. BM-2019 TaxID=2811227 RepID=UPI0031FC91E5